MPIVRNTHQVVINAPPAAVFAYVSDLTRHPEWSGGQLKIEARTSGPVAVGSEYLSHGEAPGQKDRRNELRVTRCEPPTRFDFVAKDPGFGEVTHTFVFSAQGSGTLMERTVSSNMSPLMAFAFRNFLFWLVGNPMMNRAFAALKTRLERKPV